MAEKLEMVHVDWVDSMSNNGWATPDNKVAQCSTVGFLVHKDKECLTVALNHCYDPNSVRWGHAINIPACAVTKLRKIRHG